MWLRDSTNQVNPYHELATQDPALQALLRGLINRQTACLLLDVYANAFNVDASAAPFETSDVSTKPAFLGTRTNALSGAIWERKYELDSLCACLRLSSRYYETTQDAAPFASPDWERAMGLVLDTMVEQQKGSAEDSTPEYMFQRPALEPTDSLAHAVGLPVRRTGLIKSAFRPSDDATTYRFLVPANAYAVVSLRKLAVLLRIDALRSPTREVLALRAESLAKEVQAAIEEHAVVDHPKHGRVYAYEVDGYGNVLFMDDANVPSLLSLPYLGFVDASDLTYKRTRAMLLDEESNPWCLSAQTFLLVH